MEHILEHRKKITEQLVKSYSGEESTTGAPKFLIIGHSDSGVAALTTILNALEKSQSGEALSIFVDNNIDESKHQIPSAIDSIVLKGFSVEQLLIIKEDTGGKLEKSYIPELIDLIKAEDSVIEEKYKKKIAALKERRDPEGVEKPDDDDDENFEKGGVGSRGGKVVGYTKSGKPIYQKGDESSTKHFSSQDHRDAESYFSSEQNHKAAKWHGDVAKRKEHHESFKEGDRVEHKTSKQKGTIVKTDDGGHIVKYDDEAHNKASKNTEHGAYVNSGNLKHSLKKSETLTPGEIERQRIVDNLQKAYSPIFEDPDYLEKGKKAEVGEIRTWGGVKYVKHQDGWVTFNQKTGKGSVYGSDGKKKMDVGEHHKEHYNKHYKENEKKDHKDPLKEMGYSDSDIEDFLNEYAAGGSKVPEKVREVLDKRFLNQNKTEKTTKPTLEEVDSAFSAAGKALAEGRDPDAITTLRDQAKKLGAAYGMSNEKIDEAISTSKKAHQDNYQPTAKESLDHAMNFHRDESSNDNLNSKVRALHNTLADYYGGHRSLDKKDLHEALEIAKDRVENEETEGPRKKWQSVVNHLQSKIKATK